MTAMSQLIEELFDHYERGGFSVAEYAIRPGRPEDEILSIVFEATGFEAPSDVVDWYSYFDGTHPVQIQLAPSFSAALSLDQACQMISFGTEFFRENERTELAMPFFPIFGWEGAIGDGNVMLDGPDRGLLRLCEAYTTFHPIHAQDGFEQEAKTLTLRNWVQRLVDAFTDGRVVARTSESAGKTYHNVGVPNDDQHLSQFPWLP